MLTWEDDLELHALRKRGWTITAVANQRQARPQNSARGYSAPMGGQARLTAAGIKKQLQEASDRCRDHALAGDDMARAGEELAAAVDRILMPAPCGLPREVVLRAKRESESVDPQALR